MSSRTYRPRPPKDGGTNRRQSNMCPPQSINKSVNQIQTSNYNDILLYNHRNNINKSRSSNKTDEQSDYRSVIHRSHFLPTSSDHSDKSYLDGFTLIKKYQHKSKRHKRTNYSSVFNNQLRSPHQDQPNHPNAYSQPFLNKKTNNFTHSLRATNFYHAKRTR